MSAEWHVERHARKRYARDRKLAEPPKVWIVALREAVKQPREPGEAGDGKHREYSCRFVVKGHPRLQVCGPGLADWKLIWISPFVKGDPGKPMKRTEMVYAVIR